MENTKYSNSSNGTYGGWLESPRIAYSDSVWFVNSNNYAVNSNTAYTSSHYGVRPAIEVAKTNIDYYISQVKYASKQLQRLNPENKNSYAANEKSYVAKLEQLKTDNGNTIKSVEGKKVVIVDDVITSGKTMREVINAVRDLGAEPTVCTVLIDKAGLSEVEGVPVESLIKVSKL